MRNLLRNSVIVAVALLLAFWAMSPPEKKLRLGKDLAGGVSLTYTVSYSQAVTDKEQALNQMISVLKERVDPNNQLEISFVAQGTDRVEVTMPLPSENVKQLRAGFDAKLDELVGKGIDPRTFEKGLELEGAAREAQFERWAKGDEARVEAMREAAGLYESYQEIYDEYEKVAGKLNHVVTQIIGVQETDGADSAVLGALQNQRRGLEEEVDALAVRVREAERAYLAKREVAIGEPINREMVLTALNRSDKPIRRKDEGKDEYIELPSPREVALEQLYAEYPTLAEDLQETVALWEAYEADRDTLDDPEDLKRLLRGAGVLEFRIRVAPGSLANETELREKMREQGPAAGASDRARWFKLKKLESYAETVEQFQAVTENSAGFFASRGYVVEPYLGEYYMLLWDERGKRLTKAEGAWGLTGANSQTDQWGMPAVGFRMNSTGADKLGDLTAANVNEPMAILLDGQVISSPNINSRIASSGIITGNFTWEEVQYIAQTLSAGSVAATLSAEPISESTLAPTLGQENLEQGMFAGIVALVAVSVFMVLYYFFGGVVAVAALLMNAVFILGIMALNRSAFTLPGIAGIILTFGMAVDANVLIYERIREELLAKADLRTAVRLGYQRALSSIVDGNVTNLIVCVVLGQLGTPEIKGFALTLGVGVVSTMFTSLFVTRLIVTIFVDKVHMRRMPMLPMVVPVIEKLLFPKIDWMKYRFVFLTVSVLLLAVGAGVVNMQRSEILDTEFLGGTQVDLRLKEENGERLLRSRQDIEDGIRSIPGGEQNEAIATLHNADIIVVNPQQVDGQIVSSQFKIKTSVTDTDLVLRELTGQFEKVIDSQPGISFVGSQSEEPPEVAVRPIFDDNLSQVFANLPVDRDVREFSGGVAILLRDMEPMPSLEVLEDRMIQVRSQPDYSATLNRNVETLIVEGTPEAVKTAVVLVLDPNTSAFDDDSQWETEVERGEWQLVRDALTVPTDLASVQSFSSEIAARFAAQAVVAVLISSLLIIIYVWVRFGSLRYSLAALITSLHDVLIVVGLIAAAEVLYERAPELAVALKIMPFKIDLNLVAAILTILGYSLNDTIIIMDRIRENRGKLPYASRDVVNLSINQTISRTVITSGTTLLAAAVLYVFGGEGVREFAYALLIGIGVGTYSSIAIASPLVWSRKADRSLADDKAITAVANGQQ